MSAEVPERFEIFEALGQGATGTVLRARDRLLDRWVAIKRVESRAGATRATLLDEARRGCRVSHANVATLYDVVDLDGDLCLVMEFVDGSTLRIAPSHDRALRDVVIVLRQLASAVATLHRADLVHGDIKPENVLLTPSGQAKLVDFGSVAQRGTPGYRHPSASGAAGDLFGLAITAYEWTTGIHPFGSGELPDHYDGPLPASELRLDVTRALDRLFAEALSPDPRRRPVDALELVRNLDLIAEDLRDGANLPEPRPMDPTADRSLVAMLPVQVPSLPDALGVALAARVGRQLDRATAPVVEVIPIGTVLELADPTPQSCTWQLGAELVVLARVAEDRAQYRVGIEVTDRDDCVVTRMDRRVPLRVDLLEVELARLICNSLGWPTPAGVHDSSAAGTHRLVLEAEGQLLRADAEAALQGARRAAREALDSDPHDPRALLVSARAAVRAHRRYGEPQALATAARLAGEAVQRHPESPAAWEAEARVAAAEGRVTDADAALRRAIRLDPDHDELVHLLARVHGRVGRLDQEVTILRDLAKRRPGHSRSRSWLVGGLVRAGLLDEARHEATVTVRLSPHDPRSHATLGSIEMALGDHASAVAHLARSSQLYPRWEVANNLGAASVLNRDYAAGVDAYQQALSLRPDDYRIWVNLADAYRLRGDDRASGACRRALELGRRVVAVRPYDALAWAVLAEVAAHLGDAEEARRCMNEAVSRDEHHPYVCRHLATATWALGDRSAGREWLRRAVRAGLPEVEVRSPVFDAWGHVVD